MGKKIRREIKNIIQTMLEAHGHVMLLLKERRISEANTLLAQCQDCAMHIGETIEKNEGMDAQAVLYLERYCEQLYMMSKAIDRKKIKRLKQQLDDSLHHVEHEIDKDQTAKVLKIVFMPYKAAMWDCMESVWEAANADKECETYIVPIPYYERDAQGKAETFCYDGNLFPSYLPIISYKNFSLEAEQPDIIYIHNPYENANYVTSVHPDYYSSNLKKYTDMLVYIPYYILGDGPMPEMHRNLPAYKYIDKIIVQDDEKKESLLDEISEDKIVVIGSPKVDRLLELNKKKEKILKNEIPLEWKEKIVGKKIVLFNISITGILQNCQDTLDKIRYVLSNFINREDVVLLWRPHPLIEATLKSMRPEMYKEYMQIKNTFINKNTGILDESGDAGIAAVIADAYIGENSSSLVHYFGVLGKPVLFIDWTVKEDIKRNRDFLCFFTFYREKNKLFFVPVNTGLAHNLYQLDLNNGMIEKYLEFPGSSDYRMSCYMKIKKVMDKIILVPCTTEDIYIYDMKKKQAIKMVLSNPYSTSMRFHEAVEYKGKIFLIPRCYPAIVKVDIQSMEITEFEECIAPFWSKEKDEMLFIWAFITKEQYLYLAGCNESKILIFNMEDSSYEIKKIGNYPYGYGHMIYDGNYYWLTAFNSNHVVMWDEKTGETREYSYPIKQKQLQGDIWTILVDNGAEIIVCCGTSIDIIFIDKITGKYGSRRLLDNELTKMRTESIMESWTGFTFAEFWEKEEKTVIMYNAGVSDVILWNIDADSWKRIPCRLPRNEMLDMERKYIEEQCLTRSTPYSLFESIVSISQFVDYIVTWDTDIFKQNYKCYKMSAYDESTIGMDIHEYIKNNI